MVSDVGVLDKLVRVLDALATGPATLQVLVERTDLTRATAHRLATALESHQLVDRDGSGRFRLGPRLVQLGARATVTRPLEVLALPALTRLRDETGESVQLYVRDGEGRRCVSSLESPHGLRTIVPVGAVLPMDRGSAAHALRGDRMTPRRRWVESVEERERGVASVSAPVHGPDGAIVGAVSVSGPVERTSRAPGRRYGSAVVACAADITAALAGATPG